ncbi:terminase small subunit [Bacillus testis]|uniref:terminase small subunit n=1 Tax=Bacillus testis TaxID=1622072 RepID=UPI00067EF878|nr:terminase small subunit [Bacillus testis]
MNLTPKQKKFADHYIVTGNATQAAIRAGYSEKTARSVGAENLTKPYIRSFIDERMAAKDAERIASQDEILAYLTSIMRGEHTEQTLRGVGEGVQVIDDIDIGAKDRLKAAELLGKRYAMWTDNKNLTGNVGVIIIDDIGDEE